MWLLISIQDETDTQQTMDGLQVLFVLLSSREGFFLWGIMGAAVIILIASWFADMDSDEHF